MTEGLITRIGRWIDNKWEAKATERDVETMVSGLNQEVLKTRLDLEEKILKAQMAFMVDLNKIRAEIGSAPQDAINGLIKDSEDLKTRIERLELYSGMTRKVDPTKPPVVKSAFSM